MLQVLQTWELKIVLSIILQKVVTILSGLIIESQTLLDDGRKVQGYFTQHQHHPNLRHPDHQESNPTLQDWQSRMLPLGQLEIPNLRGNKNWPESYFWNFNVCNI